MLSLLGYDQTSWNKFLEAKAVELNLTPAQTRVFLTRFSQDNWLHKIEDIWQQSDVNSCEAFTKHSTKIYQKFKPYCFTLSKGAGNFTILRDWLLQDFKNYPLESYQLSTANHLNNTYLIEGSKQCQLTVASECYQTILQPGALIRIKAPSKMGKTSLLNNVLAYADKQAYRTVHINLLQIERDKFSSLEQFLRWFCVYLSDSLDVNHQLDRFWNEDRGSMLSCTRYLEMLLQDNDTPLVLGLDEVDRLLNYPDISQDFFYLLRSWHEEANNDELWEQLKLVVVYSTEDFGSLDINQSPFNVGLPVELQPFNQKQVEELTQLYQLDLSAQDIKYLMQITGGHPYLVDLALSHLVHNPEQSLAELLQQAATDMGIYSSYLRQHLINLKSNSKLTKVFLDILNSPEPIQIDTLLAYQLYRMGLIQWSKGGNRVIPSCDLYKLYFPPRLSNQ
ncbi:AAA-like domain-containing protein [Pleurocapsa sp. PCC 7319]|uniref:AAA-like domain-containing protein n=1 Tax=Pleurocapsa sp. PCC 7319 TaxID=118161 RepID=UPI000348BF6E|nr:AAA-like domain-containing protein [Pleurocapsa sp. PCC 7319]